MKEMNYAIYVGNTITAYFKSVADAVHYCESRWPRSREFVNLTDAWTGEIIDILHMGVWDIDCI